MASGEGLWLTPCSSIHTFFMRYPIDAVFLDRQSRVLYCVTLPPWRVSRLVRRAAGVLELRAGEAARTGIKTGDHLTFKEQP